MEAIERFLHTYPPFSDLGEDRIKQIAAAIRIEQYQSGQDILTYAGPPAQSLYIVRHGRFDLIRPDRSEPLDSLVEGDLFGYVSLLREAPPVVTVRANGDSMAYLIPIALFQQLRHNEPLFAQFFTRSVGERLHAALRQNQLGTTTIPELFQTRLRDIARSGLVAIPSDATVREAARLMRDRQVSCLIVDLPPYGTLDLQSGIITDRDLRNRVLADGRPDTTPVSAIMSFPVYAMPDEQLVFEGLLAMLEHGIHHLPISSDGLLTGIVTFSDILRHQSHNPLLLPGQLRRSRSTPELFAYAEKVAGSAEALLQAGARYSDIGRMAAAAYDALQVHALRLAEEELGPAPCPYAWVVLGSAGRLEQILRTDQDNALIYANNAPPEAAGYFARLAELTIQRLVASGFPRCPANLMATNIQWRRPLNAWREYLVQWLHASESDALLAAAGFFDLRRVYGALNVETELFPAMLQATHDPAFRSRYASAILHQTSPVGLFRQLLTERHGDRHDRIDLKTRGTQLIVGMARLLALHQGHSATSTIIRLHEAATGQLLRTQLADDLCAAFELIGATCVRHQIHQIAKQQPPHTMVALDDLIPLERRALKDALLLVADAQHEVDTSLNTRVALFLPEIHIPLITA